MYSYRIDNSYSANPGNFDVLAIIIIIPTVGALKNAERISLYILKFSTSTKIN